MNLSMRTHGSGRYVVKPGAGLLLKQARLRAGLKQYKLGEMLGFTNQRSAQAKVHALESGRFEQRDLGHVMNASTILRVPLTDVIEWVGDDEGPAGGGNAPTQGSGHDGDVFAAA